MTIRYLLIATTALSLVACGEKARENTTSTVTTTTDATVDATSGAMSDAGDAVSDTASSVGQSEPVNAVQDAVGGVVGKVTAATANSVDAYVTNAAISDMYERDASKMALEKSKNAAVKAFAKDMIAAHTATTAEVKKIVASDKLAVTPPTALDSRRQGFIDNLKAASAADFDKVYLDQQTAAHEEALTLHKSYVDDGENADLKAFATKTAPKVQMHLDMAKKLDTAA